MGSKFKKYGLYLVGLVILFLIAKGFTGDDWSKWLKNDIKDNIIEIDSLQGLKKPILKEIEDKNKEIAKKDSIILVLSKEKNNLFKSLKYYKNENFKIKTIYINNPIDKRIELFANLVGYLFQ